MDTSTIIWIIVAVIVVAVVVALVARRSSARRVEAQRAEADSIRTQAQEHDRELRAREARAEETEAQARAARAEADRKAAEAKRLEAEAERHGEGAQEVREVRDEHLRRADETDPDVEPDVDRDVQPGRDAARPAEGTERVDDGTTLHRDTLQQDAADVDRRPLGERHEVADTTTDTPTGTEAGRTGA